MKTELDNPEINLLFLEKEYTDSFHKQDEMKGVLYNKKILLLLLFICFLGSFFCLQVEYGFLKALLILSAFLGAIKGIFWSIQEIYKITSN